MDAQLLIQIGLNLSQAKAYLALVGAGSMTPPQLAEEVDVTRTNAYELLDQLVSLELASKKAIGTKLTFVPQSPTKLKQLLIKQQQQLRQRSESLEAVLPSLLSTFRLTQEQPGVLYLEGKVGLETLFDDIIRQQDEVLILPSDHDRDNEEISAFIDTQIKRQLEAKISVRTLYPKSEVVEADEMTELEKNGIRVSWFGETMMPAQIMIYGNNVAFTTYRTGVVTTIITNPEIAASLRMLFESMWKVSEAAG